MDIFISIGVDEMGSFRIQYMWNFEYRGIPFPRDLWPECEKCGGFLTVYDQKGGIGPYIIISYKCISIIKAQRTKPDKNNLEIPNWPPIPRKFPVINPSNSRFWPNSICRAFSYSRLSGHKPLEKPPNFSPQIAGKGMPRYSKFFEIPQILNSERTQSRQAGSGDQWDIGDLVGICGHTKCATKFAIWVENWREYKGNLTANKFKFLLNSESPVV